MAADIISLADRRAERAARFPSLLERMRAVSAFLEAERRRQVRLVIPMPERKPIVGEVVTGRFG